jgi:hypothetical protein
MSQTLIIQYLSLILQIELSSLLEWYKLKYI